MNDIKNAGTTLLKKETPIEVWEAVKFVARAASTDSTRYNLTGIYFENDMLIATDGRRMHIYTDTEGKVKAYFQMKHGVDIETLKGSAWLVKHNASMLSIGERLDGKFPDWRRVLPPTEKQVCGIDAPNGKLGLTGALYPLYMNHIKCNDKYVADLTGYFVDTWSVYQPEGHGRAVKFISKNYTAVIMPMQNDETEGERAARMEAEDKARMEAKKEIVRKGQEPADPAISMEVEQTVFKVWDAAENAVMPEGMRPLKKSDLARARIEAKRAARRAQMKEEAEEISPADRGEKFVVPTFSPEQETMVKKMLSNPEKAAKIEAELSKQGLKGTWNAMSPEKPLKWKDIKALSKEERKARAIEAKQAKTDERNRIIAEAIAAKGVVTPEGYMSLRDAAMRINANSPAAKYQSQLNFLTVAAYGTIDARSYLDWKKAGRQVKKGAKALYISKPMIFDEPLDDDDESNPQVKASAPYPVFKYEDTEGDSIAYKPMGDAAIAKLTVVDLITGRISNMTKFAAFVKIAQLADSIAETSPDTETTAETQTECYDEYEYDDDEAETVAESAA
jgi:hypothetical protein